MNFTRRVSRLERRMYPKRVPARRFAVRKGLAPNSSFLNGSRSQRKKSMKNRARHCGQIGADPQPGQWTKKGACRELTTPEQASDPQIHADEGR